PRAAGSAVPVCTTWFPTPSTRRTDLIAERTLEPGREPHCDERATVVLIVPWRSLGYDGRQPETVDCELPLQAGLGDRLGIRESCRGETSIPFLQPCHQRGDRCTAGTEVHHRTRCKRHDHRAAPEFTERVIWHHSPLEPHLPVP